jgi:hypothetical protein
MGNPGASGSSGLGLSSSWLNNGAIGGARGAQVVASEDLTRAMVFTPIATAACGLTTILAMATWASQGNRQMELVSRITIRERPLTNKVTIIMCAVTAVLSWIAFAINMAISARVKQGVDALQSSIPSNQNLTFVFGAATFLPLGAAVSHRSIY